MKVLLSLIASIAMLTAVHAQTTVITITTNASGGINAITNTTASGNPIGGPIVRAEQLLGQLGGATNWAFVAYGTIGTKSVTIGNHKSRAWGGGVMGIYNFTDFIGVGGGVDEIGGLDSKGQLTLISANVQVQLPIQPFAFTGWSWTTNFTATPFLYSGIGTPLGGSISQNAVIHEGEGINVDIYGFGNWVLGGGVAVIQRQNAGHYSGQYINPIIDIHRPLNGTHFMGLF